MSHRSGAHLAKHDLISIFRCLIATAFAACLIAPPSGCCLRAPSKCDPGIATVFEREALVARAMARGYSIGLIGSVLSRLTANIHRQAAHGEPLLGRFSDLVERSSEDLSFLTYGEQASFHVRRFFELLYRLPHPHSLHQRRIHSNHPL